MEFNEIKQAWGQQNMGLQGPKDEKLKLIHQQIRRLEKRNRLLLFSSGFFTLLACLTLLFWAYLFVEYGAERMREMDIYPPFGWFIVFPIYIVLIGFYVIFKHFSNNKKSDFSQSINELIHIRHNQLSNRISLFEKIPFFYLAGIVVTALGQLITPEFSYFNMYPVSVLLALFIPDTCIVFFLFWLTRKRIKYKYYPQLKEIERILKSTNVAPS